MTIKVSKNNKFDYKKNKNKYNNDDGYISLNEIKKDRHQKQYRNYDNALRSKNLDRLLSYDDD
jgi:hypothetical protein